MIIITGKPLVPGEGEGYLIKSSVPLSFLGDIDPKTGIIKNRKSEIRGLSISNKVLYIPYTIGSTVGAYVLYRLKKIGKCPLAIISKRGDLTLVSACVISKIPLVTNVKYEDLPPTGSYVKVDGISGSVIY